MDIIVPDIRYLWSGIIVLERSEVKKMDTGSSSGTIPGRGWKIRKITAAVSAYH